MDDNEELFRLTFELSPVGICHVGLDGHWIRVNPRMCQMLGYTAEEMVATDFQHITHPDDLESDLQLVADLVEGKIPDYQMEKRYIRKDGSLMWARLRVSLRRDADGAPMHFISIIQDIHARKLAEAELLRAHAELEQRVAERTRELEEAMHELKRLANHDPLTGLYNRRGLLEAAARIQSGALRHGNPFALLYIDLDGFKAINDRFGHDGGDVVLVTSAQRINARLRGADAACRMGGDEFVIALELTEGDDQSALSLADQLRRELLAPIQVDGVDCHVQASIGIATTALAEPIPRLMDRADRAMYRAKQGSSGIEFDTDDSAEAPSPASATVRS